MASFDSLTGEYRGDVEVRSAIILGNDPYGEEQRVSLSGYVIMREWPYEGYERRVLPDGRVQIELEIGRISCSGTPCFIN